VDRKIITRQLKTLALAHPGNKLSAFGRPAFIDDSKPQVRDCSAERKSEKCQLKHRWQNERKRQPAVAFDLVQLFAHQRSNATAEELLDRSHLLRLQLHAS